MLITLEEALKLPPIIYKKLKRDELNELDAGENAVSIKMMDYGITNANSRYPILGTYGSEPCTTIIAYNPKRKTAGLYHIVTSVHQDKSGIKEMIDKMRANDEDPITIRLLGAGQYGEPQSKRIADIQSILDAINEIPNIKIRGADILDKPHPDTSAIDARTGQLIRGSPDCTPEAQCPEIPTDFATCLRDGIAAIVRWPSPEERFGRHFDFF